MLPLRIASLRHALLGLLALAASAAPLGLATDARAALAAPRPATGAPPSAAPEFPEDWFWRLGPAGTAHKEMAGKPPPPLTVRDWSGEPDLIKQLESSPDLFKTLRGKVVVVDFWGTWCGPCRQALPKTAEMAKELADKGLVVLGVHDSSRGTERMLDVAKANGVEYPLSTDVRMQSATAWKVGFWPTYAVIDRRGILRAIGLQPARVREVVEKLLAEPAPPEATAAPAAGDDAPAKKDAEPAKPAEKSASPAKPDAPKPATPLPAAMLEGKADRRAALRKFDGAPPAPELPVSQWTDASGALGGAQSLAELRGKIVVLDFWATWCGPCIASIPKLNDLARKYADKGVVFIGVCHARGGDKMLATAKQHGIAYPICLDASGAAGRSYVVDSYPDYYVIDREGRLRGADVTNDSLEAAIQRLLKE